MAADPGTSHAKRGRPSVETLDLLGDANAALRRQLRWCIVELEPVPSDQLGLDGKPLPARSLDLASRVRIVELMGKCMTLLGQEVVTVEVGADAPARRRRARKPEL